MAIISIGVSGLAYLLLAVHIPRWGIDWNPGAMPWNPVALPERDRIVFWSAHIVLLAVVLFALVERRRARSWYIAISDALWLGRRRSGFWWRLSSGSRS